MPWRFHEVQAPKLQDNRNTQAVTLSTLRTGHLYPQDTFLVLISVKAESTQGHSADEDWANSKYK
jgi:hypothetical protein